MVEASVSDAVFDRFKLIDKAAYLQFVLEIIRHRNDTLEIPACGSMLLADRSDEHRVFFDESNAAVLFSSEAELLGPVDGFDPDECASERNERRIVLCGFFAA